MHQQQFVRTGQQQENTDPQKARQNKDSEFTSYLGEETNSYLTTVGQIWHRTEGRGG